MLHMVLFNAKFADIRHHSRHTLGNTRGVRGGVKGQRELRGLMAVIAHLILKRSGGNEQMSYMEY